MIHTVSVAEVEEALRADPVFRRMNNGRVRGEDVYAAMAQISAGRYLIVFLINKRHGMVLPISARDMSTAERKYYAGHE